MSAHRSAPAAQSAFPISAAHYDRIEHCFVFLFLCIFSLVWLKTNSSVDRFYALDPHVETMSRRLKIATPLACTVLSLKSRRRHDELDWTVDDEECASAACLPCRRLRPPPTGLPCPFNRRGGGSTRRRRRRRRRRRDVVSGVVPPAPPQQPLQLDPLF